MLSPLFVNRAHSRANALTQPGTARTASSTTDDPRGAQLLDRITQSLADGHPVIVRGREYRLLRRGQILLEGNDELEVLEHAIYGRLPQYRNNLLVGYLWGKFVNPEHARAFFREELTALTATERDALFVDLLYQERERGSHRASGVAIGVVYERNDSRTLNGLD
jgi:hypothetical protein